MTMARKCGTCRWLRVPAGERRITNRVYYCDYPLPQMPPLPLSVTSNFQYRPLEARMMCPSYGEHCPTWERIEKPKKARAAIAAAVGEVR